MRFFVVLFWATVCLSNCGYVPEGTEIPEKKRWPGDTCDDVEEPWNACIDGYVCSKTTGTCEPANEATAGTMPQEGLCTSNVHSVLFGGQSSCSPSQ